jgi:ubiquinone/menaquinone biosynthesis C-methylase UbiE
MRATGPATTTRNDASHMSNQLMLGLHFFRELLSRSYEYPRVPEPRLVMDEPESVRQYRDAGLATGNGSSIYLYNLLLLTSAVRPGSTVVDLACGPANLLIELAKLHPEAHFIGVDLSAEMLHWAEQLKANAGVTNVRFIEADITDIQQLPPNCADLVMSTLSLHHLPDIELLGKCFKEIARILKSGGAVHLMDFASLKRNATARYFVYERTKGLGEFLAKDYEYSLRAAYRLEEFAQLAETLRAAAPHLHVRKTFGVPFLMALSTLNAARPDAQRCAALARYWQSMLPPQRADFNAMRLFFKLDGWDVPHPGRWSSVAAT